MTKREAILAVLEANEVRPDAIITTTSGKRTAFDIMEAHIMAAMDEIEEESLYFDDTCPKE